MRTNVIPQTKFFLILILTFALACSVAVPACKAQTVTVAHFEVPFSFTVQSTVMPAGAYEVRRVNGSTLSIGSSQSTVYATYYPDDLPRNMEETSVVFLCKGQQFYLARVAVAGSGVEMNVGYHR